MKWLAAVCFIPFFAHADLPTDLIKYLEKTEVITPADSYKNGDTIFAENENSHRKIKFSFRTNSFAQAVKFPSSSNYDDMNFYGVGLCHSIFLEFVPKTRSDNWDESTPDEIKLEKFMGGIKFEGMKSYGEKKTKVNGWNLSVNLKPDQLWCTANK